MSDRDKNQDRLPPHSIEAEQGVLGCCLTAPAEVMDMCLERFKGRGTVFYDLRHQGLFNQMTALHDAQKPIDLITVQQKLKDADLLEPMGGIAYLSSLLDATPSAANAAYYLDIVMEKHLLRCGLKIVSEALGKIYTATGKAEDVILGIEAEMSALTEAQATAGAEVHIKEVLWRVVDDMEKRHYTRGTQQLMGLPTGKPGVYLDKLMGGIEPEDYIVLAGRPGSGKTTLAVQIAEYLATDYEWFSPTGRQLKNETGEDYPEMEKKRGVPVAIFSIEMTAESVGYRLLFKRAGVDLAQYRQGFAPADYIKKLTVAQGALSHANIYIDASPAQGIGQIAAKARRMAKQHGIKLFILDYIQLVEMEGGNGMDRVKELTKISRKIMALKKQLKVPWVVCAQMNRNIETAEKERMPVMADLKDCGALEQDADKIMFTYRTPRLVVAKRPKLKDEETGNEYEGPSQEEQIKTVAKARKWKWSELPYRVDIVVAKNRNGPTGHAEMIFQNNMGQFHDWHTWKVEHGIEEKKSGERDASLGIEGEEV